MKNPVFLNLFNARSNEVIEYDIKDVDRITIAPARELMSPTARTLDKVDALDLVLRVQLKGECCKEYPLTQWNMEFIYP